jgi:hypothetical protein
MNPNYFSNSIGAVVPLPDSPSPLPWNPLWLPISKEPPKDPAITPLSTGRFLIGEPENNNFNFTDDSTFNYNDVFVRIEELLASHPELKKVLVGFFLTTVVDKTITPHQYSIQYNIYNTSNSTKQLWENWKLSAQANPNQINGIFYIYRPWYNNSPNPIPLRKDKTSLQWQVPTTGIPIQQKVTGISWSCPARSSSSQMCGQPIPNPSKYPLTYRGLRKTNRVGDPCFLQDAGCLPGSNNLATPTCVPDYDNPANTSCSPDPHKNKVLHGQYNIDLPFAHNPNSVQFNANNPVSPNEYDFLFQPLS